MTRQVSIARTVRRAVFLVSSAIFELLVVVDSPAEAAIIVWDDDGGTASKLWSNNNNWNPNGSPAGNDVYVGVNSVGTNLAPAANDRTLFDSSITINSLTVGNGADVVNSTDDGATNDFKITVTGETVVGGTGSSIIIYGDNTVGLDTDNLFVDVGAVVDLRGGAVQVGHDLYIYAGGALTGHGIVQIVGGLIPGVQYFRSNGVIQAVGGTMRIEGTPGSNGIFDWDGVLPGAAVVEALNDATLIIDMPLLEVDNFDGTINIGQNAQIQVNSDWRLNGINSSGGVVNLYGGGSIATLSGNPWIMSDGGSNARLNAITGVGVVAASLSMIDGTTTVAAGAAMQFDGALTATGGTINNSGTLIFNADATIGAGVDFNMIGGGASLVINSTVNIDTPDFNLDGDGIASNVTTINAGGNLDLDVGVGADLQFHHTINMNGGELDVTTSATTSWQLHPSGIINAAGGATSTINSVGETFLILGAINVVASSTLTINAASNFGSTANVTIGAGSTLDLATATYAGGSYTGSGLFRPGNFTVSSDTTFDFPTSTVDLDDGSTANINAVLTINASSVETSFPDGYDGTMNIANAGRLNVNITGGGSWRLDGTINYNGDATPSIFLGGSRLVIQSGATLNVNGEGTTLAPLDIAGTININTGGEDLALAGGSALNTAIHNMAGGTIDGPGQLEIPNTSRLIGFGTIDAPIRALTGIAAGGDVLADGGTLTINGEIISADIIGTNSASGVLQLDADSFNTSNVTALELKGGSVIGSYGNDGITRGFGTIATNSLFNQGFIRATGNGLLIIDTVSNPDLDGSFGLGVEIDSIEATEGNLQVVDPLNDPFDTNAIVGANHFIRFDSGWTLTVNGELNLNGGTTPATAAKIGGALQTLQGAINVDQNAQFDAPTTFGSTVTVSLSDGNDMLRLASDSTVAVGATFNGNGRLVNLTGATLTTEDDADIGVTIENQGMLAIGASPGDLEVEGFTQTSRGTLEIELANVTPGNFDLLTVQGNAVLGGTLDVSLINSFVPILGNTFTVLETVFGNVSGTFSIEDFPTFSGLTFDVVYNSKSVVLQVITEPVLPGDFDMDGDVDGRDFLIWQRGGSPNPMSGGDLADWQANYGAGSLSASVVVPEPGCGVLLTGAALAGLGSRRRKRVA